MKTNMFYGAHPFIFKRAEQLRNRLTLAEEILWNYLRESQAGCKFRRQHPAANYVLDFYSHKLKLAIEIDGDIHSLEEVKRNDEERQNYLEGLGIKFLRFSNYQVLNEPSVILNKIQQVLKENQAGQQSKTTPSEAGGFVIPAIDIIEGKCVRLTQGDYSQKKIYNEHPLEVAKQFEDAGLMRLHLVDLDGAKAGSVKNWKVLETIAGKSSLIIDFGGGIKTEKDLDIVFNSGAALATIGSLAVKNETEFISWLSKYGAHKFLLGADVKEERIAISGWIEKTDIWIYDFIEKYMEHDVKQMFCTDVSKDGKLEGPSIELYKTLIERFPELHLIASGGVSSMKDVEDLQLIGCSGVIIGKAIYEGRIGLGDLSKVNAQL